ncbi:glyoxalase [Dactylosporangium sp. NPDC049525]|uniref:glyoxalase n=1 Tax=Dactylosporangium sp. NPDC049525 TaxID=3154730 RepID=UPI00344A1B1B
MNGAASAMTFYRDVFDAIELQHECLVDGQIVRAELVVGGTGSARTICAWDSDLPATGWGAERRAAATDPLLLLECVESVAVLRRAVAAGVWVVPPADGAPAVVISDPADQRWTLADGI